MVLDLSTLGVETIAVHPDRTAIVPTRVDHERSGCTTFAITLDTKLADEFGRRYQHMVELYTKELEMTDRAKAQPKATIKKNGVDWAAYGATLEDPDATT